MADRSDVKGTFRASEWLLRVTAPPSVPRNMLCCWPYARSPFAQTDCRKQADGPRTCHPADVCRMTLCRIPALRIDAVDSALGVVVPVLAYPAEYLAHTPCPVLCYNLSDYCPHRRILNWLLVLIGQHRTRYVHEKYDPALFNTAIVGVRSCLDSLTYAYHFVDALSFITSISRSRPANNFFSRALSCVIRLSSDTWLGTILPYFRCPMQMVFNDTLYFFDVASTPCACDSRTMPTICSSVY